MVLLTLRSTGPKNLFLFQSNMSQVESMLSHTKDWTYQKIKLSQSYILDIRQRASLPIFQFLTSQVLDSSDISSPKSQFILKVDKIILIKILESSSILIKTMPPFGQYKQSPKAFFTLVDLTGTPMVVIILLAIIKALL